MLVHRSNIVYKIAMILPAWFPIGVFAVRVENLISNDLFEVKIMKIKNWKW